MSKRWFPNTGHSRKLKGCLKLLLFLGGGTLVLCWLSMNLVQKALCESQMFQEIFSPNNKLKAVVYQRDCGATTGFSTQISILDAGGNLPDKTGNVFIQDGHPEWTAVTVEWHDPHSVTITHPDDYDVYKSESRYWFVKVAYESP